MTTASEGLGDPGAVVSHTDVAPGFGVFDPHHPPSAERIDDCVHCGFCLPTCPTYSLWGEEMDSPRGRIYLLKMGLEGGTEMSDTFVGHFDACLGCMACVTACPSGVRYDELLEAARSQIERNADRGIGDRVFRAAIFAVFPHPARLRVALVLGWLYQRLGGRRMLDLTGLRWWLPERVAAMTELLPPVRLGTLGERVPECTAAAGEPRRRVGLLTGCVQRVLFPQVNAATARVLAAEGCEVIAPSGQGCCGALGVHAGREPQAEAFARRVIDTFEAAGVDTVVTNAAGCGSTMKEYGHLLRDDPVYAARAQRFAATVRDVTELLDELEPQAPRAAVAGRFAYHDACHLAHAQGVRAEPRRVLRGVPELQLTELADPEICCGSAGIYNLVQPEPAAELGRRKASAIRASGAQAVVTGNPGCLLQLRRYLDIPLYHPVEVLDASIRGVPLRGAGGGCAR